MEIGLGSGSSVWAGVAQSVWVGPFVGKRAEKWRVRGSSPAFTYMCPLPLIPKGIKQLRRPDEVNNTLETLPAKYYLKLKFGLMLCYVCARQNTKSYIIMSVCTVAQNQFLTLRDFDTW